MPDLPAPREIALESPAPTLKERIRTVKQFEKAGVLVLGDVMLDIYDFCHEQDSKPIDYEMPKKRAYRAHESIRTLGGAGNVAANLASLSSTTGLIGVTGDDGHCYSLEQIADKAGIMHGLVRDFTRPTTVKTRLYVDDVYRLRRDEEATHKVSPELADTIYQRFESTVDRYNAVILSDYNKGFFTQKLAHRIINTCTERDIPIIVDFKPVNASCFRGATIIAPNEREADALQPGFADADDLQSRTKLLYQSLECTNLIVTLGAKGICGFDGVSFFYVAGNKVQVVDAVGCGDTVRAVLALGAALGLALRETAELANDAAAAIIQKRATSTISPKEVIRFIESKSSIT